MSLSVVLSNVCTSLGGQISDHNCFSVSRSRDIGTVSLQNRDETDATDFAFLTAAAVKF
jgi:hypothetical protein